MKGERQVPTKSLPLQIHFVEVKLVEASMVTVQAGLEWQQALIQCSVRWTQSIWSCTTDSILIREGGKLWTERSELCVQSSVGCGGMVFHKLDFIQKWREVGGQKWSCWWRTCRATTCLREWGWTSQLKPYFSVSRLNREWLAVLGDRYLLNKKSNFFKKEWVPS